MRGATVALRRYFENKDRFFSKGSSVEGKENKGIVFYSAAEAKAFFEIRLNLGDLEDKKLLAILDRLVTHDCASRKPTFQLCESNENLNKDSCFLTKDLVVEDLLAYFEEGMSHNLKHDWERAKNESKAPFRYLLYARFLCLIGFFASCSKIYEKLFFDFHQISCESMLACAKATFAMGEKFTTQIVCFVFFTAILFGSIENLEKIKKVLSLKKHDRSLICICSLFYIPIVFYLSKNPWAFFCILAYLIVKLFEIYLKPSRDNLY